MTITVTHDKIRTGSTSYLAVLKPVMELLQTFTGSYVGLFPSLISSQPVLCPPGFIADGNSCKSAKYESYFLPKCPSFAKFNGMCIHESLYWRCESGKSILPVEVCDDNLNCQDTLDEQCPDNRTNIIVKPQSYAVCSVGDPIPSYLVDDLMPDCEGGGAEDEPLLLQLKKGNTTKVTCPKNHVPCVPGHRKCFPVSSVCVYDHDEHGNLR